MQNKTVLDIHVPGVLYKHLPFASSVNSKVRTQWKKLYIPFLHAFLKMELMQLSFPCEESVEM